MSHFATGVPVVTTVAGGLDQAMTSTAFMSVSLRPLLVVVSVDKTTRIHAALATSGRWAVSILPEGHAEAATWLATKGRPVADQLNHIPYRRGSTGAALIIDALAWIEAETWATYDGGDHSLVVGHVVAAERAGSVGDDDQGEVSAERGSFKVAPLVHHRGGYAALTPSATNARRRS